MLRLIQVYPRIGKTEPNYLNSLLNILKERVEKDKTIQDLVRRWAEMKADKTNSFWHTPIVENTAGEDEASRRASPQPQSDEGLA